MAEEDTKDSGNTQKRNTDADKRPDPVSFLGVASARGGGKCPHQHISLRVKHFTNVRKNICLLSLRGPKSPINFQMQTSTEAPLNVNSPNSFRSNKMISLAALPAVTIKLTVSAKQNL